MNLAQRKFAEIVAEETLSTLAKVNKTTKENITLGLDQGNQNLTAQFNKLMMTIIATGLPTRMELV